jgi:hypothetical protein
VKIAVVYCYPMVNARVYFPLAARFAATYRQFPPGTEHELHVVCNGAPPQSTEKALFDNLEPIFHPRDNTGWDIGAYQWAAEKLECDLLVCFGAHCNFHRLGWLERMVEVYAEHGPNFYGCRGYFYPAGHGHHIRTTSFWLHPQLLRSYPFFIGSQRTSRYQFEHGENNMTQWVEKSGLECLVATWDDIYPISRWKEGFGPVHTALVLDQWTHESGSRLDR